MFAAGYPIRVSEHYRWKGRSRQMNQSPGLKLNIRRAAHRMPYSVVRTADAPHKKEPLVIRRTYDISTSCGREQDTEETAPLMMRIRGERATPLLRCVAVGAAIAGITAAAVIVLRFRDEWRIRRKYARRYADRLKQQRLRMQIAHTDTKTAS